MAIWKVMQYGTKSNGETSPYPKAATCILSVEQDGHETPPSIDALLEIGKTFLTWASNKPIKRLSKASLAKRRKTRLRTKLMKKHPLFFQDFYDAELAARPSFYDGERQQPDGGDYQVTHRPAIHDLDDRAQTIEKAKP